MKDNFSKDDLIELSSVFIQNNILIKFRPAPYHHVSKIRADGLNMKRKNREELTRDEIEYIEAELDNVIIETDLYTKYIKFSTIIPKQ